MESWGGGELFLSNLVKGNDGFDFIIASPSGKAYETFNENNFKLIKINNLQKFYRKSGKWHLKDKLQILFRLIFSFIFLVRVILKNKPNLILANGNFAALYTFFAARLTNRKMIIVQHLLYDKNSLDAKVVAFISKRVHKLICVSNAVAFRTREILGGAENDKIEVIHNGVSLLEIDSLTKKQEIINVGFVGSIIRAKGLDKILLAVTPVLTGNKNVLMHIFGSKFNDDDSHSYFEEIQSIIKNNELENKVMLHGHFDSMDEVYKSIDILINFSTVEESLGYNILEAMSYSKIVIGANAGGIPELIKDKKSGFLVEQNNIEQLTKTISYCIKNFNSDELLDIRKNARETVKMKFSSEQFNKKYKNLFNSIIEEK
jgi:glycosyltransferase involved in cell wall biosynthesis